MRLPVALMLVLLLLVAGGCASNPGSTDASENADPQPLPILELIPGDISGLDGPGVFLITSNDEIAAHGSATLGALNVDFSQQALVVLALGRQATGGYWARITAVTQQGPNLIVEGKANRPAPGQIVTQTLTTPYCVAVIPKPTATLIQSNIESVVGQDPPAE